MMAAPSLQTVDVSSALANVLESVDGLRIYYFVSDTVRPPAAVIGQPDIDFADPAAGFCSATWTFPVTIITSRSNDREAQKNMSQFLLDIAQALSVDVPGIFSIEPLDARPIPVNVSGQDLPGYLLNIRIKA